MSTESFLRQLAGEALNFFEFAREALGSDLARRELVRDLGGDPAASAPVSPFPQDRLDSIRAYRDSADPKAEAASAVLRDIGTVIGAIGANYTAWRTSWRHGAQESVHALFELLLSNYVRLRFPRTFLLLQSFPFLEEVTTLNAPGENSAVRLWESLKAVGLFAWHPGRVFEELDPEGTGSRGFDFAVRLLATAFVITESAVEWDVPGLSDVLYGWDGPGLDANSPQRPRGADLIASRMATFVMAHTTGNPTADLQGVEKLKLTLAAVPRGHGGPGVFVAAGGNFERQFPLDESWQFSIKLEGAGTVNAVVGTHTRFLESDRQSALRAGLVSRAAADGGASFALPHRSGSRIEIGRLSFGTTLASNLLEFVAQITDGALVIDSGDNDGFIGALLDRVPLRLPFSIALGASTERGLFLDGAAPPFTQSPGRENAIQRQAAAAQGAMVLPKLPALGGARLPGNSTIEWAIPLGHSIGALTIQQIALRISRGPADKPLRDTTRVLLEALTTFSVNIGPVYARIDRLGVGLAIDGGKPLEQSNLGAFDLDLGLRAPRGVALRIDTGLVTGGGLLFHDASQNMYAGVMQVSLQDRFTLTAYGLITTRMPDGGRGYSLLVFVTAEGFRPVPLGFGFKLESIGGMLGVHRTFDEAVLKAGLRSNTLATLLFPRDPMANAPALIQALATSFPVKQGSYLLGLLARITWFTPTVVTLDLALILEFGAGTRLLALGRVSALLPSHDNDLIRLNMNALGELDFDAGTLTADAVLVDSRLAHQFPITGSAALRARWSGDPNFVLAVGGLNPRFAPPAGFPMLERVAIAFTKGRNPRLICDAYLAITANTVQFGSRVSLYAEAMGFSISGDLGFDALVTILPPHFLVDFHAAVQLKRGSRNLFKVTLDGMLEGPLPLRLAARAKFELLWFSYSVPFDFTLAAGDDTRLEQPAVDLARELGKVLAEPSSWRTLPPPAAAHGVALRGLPSGSGPVLDPLGQLVVQQQLVPLNTQRDVDTYGGAPVAGAPRFMLTGTFNGQEAAPVKAAFAPAQYFKMSDDDKLQAPSFETLDAGLVLGSGGATFDPATIVTAPLDYETINLNPIAENENMAATIAIRSVSPARYALPLAALQAQRRGGAAARAPQRRMGGARFRNLTAAPVATVTAPRWGIQGTAGLSAMAAASAAPSTWSECHAALALLNRGSARCSMAAEYELQSS